MERNAFTLPPRATGNRPGGTSGQGDPQAWLTDVLSRTVDHKVIRIDELLPWRYAAAAA
jgi:hypothetical protein